MQKHNENTSNLLHKLEQSLFIKCKKEKVKIIEGPAIMFSADTGCTIRYVKGLPIEETGQMKIFYDKSSSFYDATYTNISWPYTGFVQGYNSGWVPISIDMVIRWLEETNYSIDRFIQELSK